MHRNYSSWPTIHSHSNTHLHTHNIERAHQIWGILLRRCLLALINEAIHVQRLLSWHFFSVSFFNTFSCLTFPSQKEYNLFNFLVIFLKLKTKTISTCLWQSSHHTHSFTPWHFFQQHTSIRRHSRGTLTTVLSCFLFLLFVPTEPLGESPTLPNTTTLLFQSALSNLFSKLARSSSLLNHSHALFLALPFDSFRDAPAILNNCVVFTKLQHFAAVVSQWSLSLPK